MIKLSTYRVPIYFKDFRIIDPITIIIKRNKLSRKKYLSIWEYFMNYLHINGVNKTTRGSRLKSSTQYLNFFFKNSNSEISFLDVGASDGSSSFYTHCDLKENGITISTTSTDIVTSILYSGNYFLKFYFTEENIPFLCILMKTFALYLYTNRHRDALSKYLTNKFVILFNNGNYIFQSKKIELLHPDIRCDEFFKYESFDVFKLRENYINYFTVIRCSNLLQSCYFKRVQISNAIDLLKLYLKDNGLLIITQNINNEPLESGIVFQKTFGKLLIIHRFSLDSEIEMIFNKI